MARSNVAGGNIAIHNTGVKIRAVTVAPVPTRYFHKVDVI